MPAAPVFNIALSDGMLDLFRGRASASAPSTQSAGPSNEPMLIKSGFEVGPDMSIAEFCTSFKLQPSILQKLVDNAYDFARNLRFVTLANLNDMGFKLGERAALLDAIEKWSVPSAT